MAGAVERLADGRQPTVLVMGGGHNGLACATLLARAGWGVTLLEAREQLGGSASTSIFSCGCRMSRYSDAVTLLDSEILHLVNGSRPTTPWDSFLVVPDPQFVLRTAKSTIRLRHLEPTALAADLADQTGEAPAAIETFFRDLELATSAVAHLWTEPYASRAMFAEALGRVDRSFVGRFLKNSIKDTVTHYFHSDDIILCIGALSSLIAEPLTEPESIFSLLYLASGNLPFSPNYALPLGGMGAITALLSEAAQNAGVIIRPSEPVLAINVLGDRVISVKTSRANGISADYYISGFGPITTNRLISLLPPQKAYRGMRSSTRHGTGCAKINCLIEVDIAKKILSDGRVPVAKTILCDGLEAYESALADARAARAPSTLYVEVLASALILSSDRCSSHVPVSIYALFFPYDWCRSLGETEAAAEIWARVQRSLDHYLPGLTSALSVEEVITPLSLEREFGMWRGDVDHGSFADGNLLETRGYATLPHGTTELINLFNCSAGIHPGGLVTGRPGITCARTVTAVVRDG